MIETVVKMATSVLYTATSSMTEFLQLRELCTDASLHANMQEDALGEYLLSVESTIPSGHALTYDFGVFV